MACSGYLNNRYQDPATGVFLSVDPLVAETGEPYLYASGNPVSLADPTGLCASRPDEAAACFGVTGVVVGAYDMAKNGADQNMISNYLTSHPVFSHGGGNAGMEPTRAASVSLDALLAYPGAYTPPPQFGLDWAQCMIGSNRLSACGTPNISNRARKGITSYHQAWWCFSRGSVACAWAASNSRVAEAQAEVWAAAGVGGREVNDDEVNAMMHALWFGLNSSSTSLGLSQSDLRALGIAHEMDWRDSYIDAARDLLNNEVGLGMLTNGDSSDEVIAQVESAFGNGDLYCSGGGVGPVAKCGAG